MNLAAKVAAQIKSLREEKDRIKQQATTNLLEIDVQLDALTTAQEILTPDVEAAYAALRSLGLVKEL